MARCMVRVFLCVLLLAAPAVADEKKDGEPKKPASKTGDAQREAALLRAEGLTKQSIALYRARKYTEAIALGREVLEIEERVLGPKHPRVGTTVANLADMLAGKGDFRAARPLLERALRIFERTLGPDHDRVADCLNSLAIVLHEQGAHAQARPLFERVLAHYVKSLGPGHLEVARVASNLALVLRAQGAYEESEQLLRRALDIREKSLGSEHPAVAASLRALGQTLASAGDHERARPHLERALAILESASGPQGQLGLAVSLNGLATLLVKQGAYAEAVPLFERTLATLEPLLGPEHPHVATILNNLGAVHREQGLHEDARPFFERALKIREKTLGSDHADVATSLNNLATLLHAQGAYEESGLLLERALRIAERTLGVDHPDVASSLNNLAFSLQARGAHEKAKPLYQRALRVREEALGPRHPDVVRSLGTLAMLHVDQGSYKQAAELLARGLDVIEHNLRRSVAGLQQSQRLAISQLQRRYLFMWLVVAPHVGTSGLNEVLRFKGLLARVAAAERRVMRSPDDKIRDRLAVWRTATRRVSKLATSAPSFRAKAKRAAWQKAYAGAAAERERLATAFQRDLTPMRQGLERLDIVLADVQRTLGTDEVLLEFLNVGSQYLAWIVRPGGQPKGIDLGDAEPIESAATAFVEAAADDAVEVGRTGRALRELVWTPIAKHLGKDVRTIYVCPDAALAAVPFAALPANTEGSLLIDEYRLSTISMAQDLVPWPDAPKPGAGALVFGGVDYGEADVGDKETTKRALADHAPRGGRSFTYLRGTKKEAETLRTSLGDGTTVLLGKHATENRLRAMSKGKRVLHLATHGFVRTDLMKGLRRRPKEWLGAGMERQLAQGHDPMLLAGLALAGANPREGGHGDDGILTALEASHLHLDGVELVVLSACQTAAGRAESGEGVIGLVQGFQQAGAKRVIGSLWKVSDAATEALMVKFYELWSPKTGKGLSAAEALRTAQQYVRAQDKWKHPYYWAAWSVWGPND